MDNGIKDTLKIFLMAYLLSPSRSLPLFPSLLVVVVVMQLAGYSKGICRNGLSCSSQATPKG
jgi:hypothetical protein